MLDNLSNRFIDAFLSEIFLKLEYYFFFPNIVGKDYESWVFANECLSRSILYCLSNTELSKEFYCNTAKELSKLSK